MSKRTQKTMATGSGGSVTVRVNQGTHAALRRLARDSGRSMTEVLDQAIETYHRQRFLDEVNTAYAALREDASAWADYRSELKV